MLETVNNCDVSKRASVRHFCSGRHLVQFLGILWKIKVHQNKTNASRLKTHHGVSLSEI